MRSASPIFTAFRARAKRERSKPALLLPTFDKQLSDCKEVTYDTLLGVVDALSVVIAKATRTEVRTRAEYTDHLLDEHVDGATIGCGAGTHRATCRCPTSVTA